MERLGYGGEYYDEDEYYDYGDEPDEEEEEQVEHAADFLLDAAGQTDRFLTLFRWRWMARAGRQGQRWDPPDTTAFVAPVFVRVQELRGSD